MNPTHVTPAPLVDVNARDVFKREFVHARRYRLEGALIQIICTFRADFDAHRARARASLVSNVSADVPTRRTLARGSFVDDETWRRRRLERARATRWTTSWMNEYLFHDRAEHNARERAQRAISTSNRPIWTVHVGKRNQVHSTKSTPRTDTSTLVYALTRFIEYCRAIKSQTSTSLW